MACILKLPTDNSRGIVTFTTQEQRIINKSRLLQDLLVSLKSKYALGLHFNWHSHQFKPDSKFDFFMAGEDDLLSSSEEVFRLIPMDACNFTPTSYSEPSAEKYWDILIVGNPVSFKRPEIAIQTIRKLFDNSKEKLKVLYICPIPKYKKSDERTTFYNIREYYDSLFTKEEKNYFTLLTTNFNSPFPLDRNTLSFFFRSSKIFLHCPKEERRCRIAAYAWCAGMPVVSYPSVASILPAELRSEPGFFCVDKDDEYASKIIAALNSYKSFNPIEYRKVLSESHSIKRLESQFRSMFSDFLWHYEGEFLSMNLDIRLGWHHQGIGGENNGLKQPLYEFMTMLLNYPSNRSHQYQTLSQEEYPERVLSGEIQAAIKYSADDLLNKFDYLKPPTIIYKVWSRVTSSFHI